MAAIKLNEVEKVSTMNNDSYVPFILPDGNIGQIERAALANIMADMMRIQSINENGLYPRGAKALLSSGNNDVRKLLIKYQSKSHLAAFLQTGSYETPSIYLLNIGMHGGMPSGHPYRLSIKLISGPSVITGGKAFLRNDKTCIELTYNCSLAWTTNSIIDFRSLLDGISYNNNEMYNQDSDTNMVNAIFE